MGWDVLKSGWEFTSDDPRAPVARIEMSSDHLRSVVIENHGEHNIGAESIVIVPDRPVAGVSRFHTTNGEARFDPNGRWLIIEGVIGFVAVNQVDGSVANYVDPAGAFIGSWSIVGGELAWREVRAGSRGAVKKSILLDEIRARWSPGLGQFSDGVFQPQRSFIERWDEWDRSGNRAMTMLPLPSFDRAVNGAFTAIGNKSAALLALTVVVTVAVIAGVMIGLFSKQGFDSDATNVFLALIAMIGLAPGLVVAESLVRHPRWVHFASDTIVVQQVVGQKRYKVSNIREIKSVHYLGTTFRFPMHVMEIFFTDGQVLRLDSGMLDRTDVRDARSMEGVDRRVRRLYEKSGSWNVVHRRYPELAQLLKAAR
jgi:hypothetical protein